MFSSVTPYEKHMEHVEAVSEVEWNSFHGGMCSEEAGFMVQLLGNCSVPNEVQTGPHYTVSTFWSANVNDVGNDEGSMYSSDDTNTNMHSFSHGGSYNRGSSNSICFPSSSHDSYYHDPNVPHQFLFNNGNLMKMDYYVAENDNNNETEGDDFLNQDVSNNSMESNETVPQDFLQEMNLGLEIKTPMVETVKEQKFSCPSGVSKRRPRIPAAEVQMSKRNTRQRKCAKVDDNDANISKNNDNAVIHRQSSRNCCSEDDSSASLELYGVNSSVSGIPKSGKTRASRGSATDPQSLYARKRRERITERFKILQNLVPNGTKVDISTMLEEAVQYVKYLQLQIKLLSSNEHWMYAPLAYNGMDIGLLDLKISAPKS